jgi:transcriptional regulator with XRE-family HTH domain
MNMMTDTMNQRISARIRIERESRGWSLSELAERASVSRAMIHKIERGDSSPTATLLARLSGAFGISMSTLIARAEMQEGSCCAWQISPSGVTRKRTICAVTFHRALTCLLILSRLSCPRVAMSRCQPLPMHWHASLSGSSPVS